MKHTIKTVLCLLLCSGFFTACNNSAPQTENATKTDSVAKPDHMAIQTMMAANIHEFAAYSSLGNAAPQPMTIQFGAKAGGDTLSPIGGLGCNPGTGICNIVQNLGAAGTPDSSLVSQGTMYMYMFKASIQSSNLQFYRQLASANFSGIFTWPNNYTIPSEIATSMGVDPPNTITIAKGTPMVFGSSAFPAMGDIAMWPAGALPGNQGWLSLSNCTPINDSVNGVTLNFSPTQTGSAVQAYSAIGILGTTGFLTLYMNTAAFLSQPGICPTCLPCTAPANNLLTLITATPYTFSDSATAASMSVPLNSTIAAGGYLGSYFGSGWCSVSFMLNVPEDAAAALKAKSAAAVAARQQRAASKK